MNNLVTKLFVDHAGEHVVNLWLVETIHVNYYAIYTAKMRTIQMCLLHVKLATENVLKSVHPSVLINVLSGVVILAHAYRVRSWKEFLVIVV